MDAQDFPEFRNIGRRWRTESAIRAAEPALLAALLLLSGSAVIVFFLPPQVVPVWAAVAVPAVIWIGACIRAACAGIRPLPKGKVAKRADRVLGLDDDLLHLSEEAGGPEDAWRVANLRRARERIAGSDLANQWRVRVPLRTWALAAGAFLVTGVFVWLADVQAQDGEALIAEQNKQLEERLEHADELLSDWRQFESISTDSDLKKLFAETEKLAAALRNPDPMAAMEELHSLEQAISHAEASGGAGIADETGALADSLESFEGMSALSAALRRDDFRQAATEAQRAAERLSEEPGYTRVGHAKSTAQQLADAASRAASKTSDADFSAALGQLSECASRGGSCPNSSLAPPMNQLAQALGREALRQKRNRILAAGRSQIDHLRSRLRGEDCPGGMQSICQAAGQPETPGLSAGTAPGGEPLGDESKLANASVQELSQSQAGEGESETVTSSTRTGSAGAVGGSVRAGVPDYVELSRKAVEDENLPLAHRQIIRSYFERIRPSMTSSQ